MNNEIQTRPKFGVHHLASWYFGTFCAMKYGHGRECDDKLHEIANELEKRGIKEMTHKEFCIIARENYQRIFPSLQFIRDMKV